jgi:hypothetical protein
VSRRDKIWFLFSEILYISCQVICLMMKKESWTFDEFLSDWSWELLDFISPSCRQKGLLVLKSYDVITSADFESEDSEELGDDPLGRVIPVEKITDLILSREVTRMSCLVGSFEWPTWERDDQSSISETKRWCLPLNRSYSLRDPCDHYFFWEIHNERVCWSTYTKSGLIFIYQSDRLEVFVSPKKSLSSLIVRENLLSLPLMDLFRLPFARIQRRKSWEHRGFKVSIVRWE